VTRCSLRFKFLDPLFRGCESLFLNHYRLGHVVGGSGLPCSPVTDIGLAAGVEIDEPKLSILENWRE
jgi:hypothetical protein